MELCTLGFPFVLLFWGGWVAWRHGWGAWTAAFVMPLVALLASCGGLYFTLGGLVQAFRGVADTDPSSRAAELSDGIGAAMTGGGLLFLLALVLTLAGLVACIWGTVQQPDPDSDK